MTSRDGETVENGGGIGATSSHYVVAVLLTWPSDVATEDGHVAAHIARLQGAIPSSRGKAAAKYDAVLQLKRGSVFGPSRRLVSALGYPDLVAVLGNAQGCLQVGVGIHPGAAVVCARSGDIYVDDIGCGLHLAGHDDGEAQQCRYAEGDPPTLGRMPHIGMRWLRVRSHSALLEKSHLL